MTMPASKFEGVCLVLLSAARLCRGLGLLAATGISSAVVAAPGIAELEALGPAARPVLSIHNELSVAAVFPTKDTAQLLVFRGASVSSRSAAFEFPLVANYGAAWVEMIVIPSTSRFTIHMRTKGTCGPSIYDYRFARRGEAWVVSGLERAESECSEAGIVPSSQASYNFLTGTIVRSEFRRGALAKHVTTRHVFPAFPFESFEAFASRYETE